MSKKNIAVGIDIGTYKVKVVIAKIDSDSGSRSPTILGVGYAESKGLRHGYITHQTDAIRSIRKAVRQAEISSKIKISKAFISIGGVGLSSFTTQGQITITRADSEITAMDVEKAIEESTDQVPSSVSLNKKNIHTIPVSYKIDGKTVLGNPVGLKGTRLEVRTLFIMCLEHHLQELIQAVEDAGIEVIDIMAAPLAASLVTLSKPEKIQGCVLANIGSETVSIIVYENDTPTSLEIFPIGSNDITNDIALGLQVSLDEAENIKKDVESGKTHPKKKLDEIISARLSDIFELVEAHLKKINKSGLLPGGIIITGGGSGITTIEDLAKAYLKLPTKVSKLACDDTKMECSDSEKIKVKDSTWSVAYGLCVFGLHSDSPGTISLGHGKRFIKASRVKVLSWFKQFLP
ncbi:MAG: cell division protein FtsA [Candidatus Paceibacteria bacterium]|jgi:cell division protein FtsA